jgi:acetolactate synthase regulatory subunit
LVAFSISATSSPNRDPMTWNFQIQASDPRRLLSRILQILDTQGVSIHSFSGETKETQMHVQFVISSEEDKAYRIESLLYRLHEVQAVSKLEQPSTTKAPHPLAMEPEENGVPSL